MRWQVRLAETTPNASLQGKYTTFIETTQQCRIVVEYKILAENHRQRQSIIANLLVGRQRDWPWLYEYSGNILSDLMPYIRGQKDVTKIGQDREKLIGTLTPNNRALI